MRTTRQINPGKKNTKKEERSNRCCRDKMTNPVRGAGVTPPSARGRRQRCQQRQDAELKIPPCSKSLNTTIGPSQERQPAGVIKARRQRAARGLNFERQRSRWQSEDWTGARPAQKEAKQHSRSHCTQWTPSPGVAPPRAPSSRQLPDGCGLFFSAGGSRE